MIKNILAIINGKIFIISIIHRCRIMPVFLQGYPGKIILLFNVM